MSEKAAALFAKVLTTIRQNSTLFWLGSAWFLFSLLLLNSAGGPDGLTSTILVPFFILWVMVLRRLNEKFPDIVPALLFLAIGLVMVLSKVVALQMGTVSGGWFLAVVQTLLLIACMLVLGLIIFSTSKRGWFVLVLYTLVAQWGISSLYELDSSASPLPYFVNNLLPFLVLFLLHLRRTRWLEKLSRTQCWLALGVAIVIGMELLSEKSVYVVRFYTGTDLSLINYGLPYFFLLFVLLFLLAIVVKLPLVMIYNHARLKRKLWIAGLLQSTIPQISQLLILLVVFFYVIAGWQGFQVKNGLENELLNVSKGNSNGRDTFVIPLDSLGQKWPLTAMQVPEGETLPASKGVLTLADSTGQPAYFLFRKRTYSDTLALVQLHQDFLEKLTTSFVPFAGSSLLAYAGEPGTLESWFYRLESTQTHDRFQIFPFNIFVRRPQSVVLASQFSPGRSRSGRRMARAMLDRGGIVVGRVLLPVYDSRFQRAGSYFIDVFFRPTELTFARPLTSLLLNLLIAFFLINSLVIRRMVKFGEEIHDIIVRKFQLLQRGIREIARGNLDYQVQIDGDDEFVELAGHFNEMSKKLKANIAELHEKNRLESELRIAREVQLSLLPGSLPEIPGYEIAADLRTATEVGGDFYDIQHLGNGVYMFTIGDVSGKSTSAAFYMAQAISLLRYSPQFTFDLRSILARLNDYFTAEHAERHIFVTMVIGILDTKKDTVTLARAGHTEPVLLHGSGPPDRVLQMIHSKGLGIGLTPNRAQFEKNIEEKKVRLKAGDALVLYTDGVVEASVRREDVPDDEAVGFFGDERFQEILKQNRRTGAREMTEKIMAGLQAFYGGAPLFDDYTIMVIRKK